jgi:hypothetical protein
MNSLSAAVTWMAWSRKVRSAGVMASSSQTAAVSIIRGLPAKGLKTMPGRFRDTRDQSHFFPGVSDLGQNERFGLM